MLRRLFLPIVAILALLNVNAPKAHAAAGEVDCASVCKRVRAELSVHSRLVEIEEKKWQDRLHLKGDIVRYDRGESAVEALLPIVSQHHRRHAPGGQMDPEYLSLLRYRCFPEAEKSPVHARMSGIVGTVWAAEHLNIGSQILTCNFN